MGWPTAGKDRRDPAEPEGLSAQLGDLFPDDERAGRALAEWARSGVPGATVLPATPRWRPKGESGTGALLTAVAVPGHGNVVVKVCPADLRREADGHARAQQAAGDRVTKLLFQPWPMDDGRQLIFQAPAGGSLRDVDTLAALWGRDLADACAYIVNWLLTGWNRGLEGGGDFTPTTAMGFLRAELDSLLCDGGSVLAYGASVGAAAPDMPWIEVDGRVLPNPLAMASASPDLPDPAVLVVRGRAHGDLHLQNVMLPRREGRLQHVDFRLIDLTTFAEDAPLSRDVATLLLSALAPRVRDGLPADQERALLGYLVGPLKGHRDLIIPELERLVQSVRRVCDRVATDGWKDIWTDHYLLSLQATALRFTSYENLQRAGRWWFFRLAAHAGGELMERHRCVLPGTGTRITAPEVTGPVRPLRVDGDEADTDEWWVVEGEPGACARGAESVLLEVDERTVRTLEAVLPSTASPVVAAVRLPDLYVTRDAQAGLIDHVCRQWRSDDRGAVAVLGEPGSGKSCLLWGLRRGLLDEGHAVVTVSAAALLTGQDGTGDLTAPELLAGLRTQQERLRRRAPVRNLALLLDTADLLLHQVDDAKALVWLIQEARDLGVAVVVACRSGEARLLEELYADEDARGTADLLSKHHLRGYADGGEDATRNAGGPWTPGCELDRAIETHLRVFCRAPDQPAPRDGRPVEPSRPLDQDRAEKMRATLAFAVARGLPLGELVRHPLSLRMLFDLYAPAGPGDRDLDVAGLFRDYWDNRVVRDVRHAFASDPAADDEAELDLSGATRVIGLAMLQAGRPELARTEVRDTLAARLGLDPQECAGLLSVLLRRGVLRTLPADRIAFHHQAFAEYAAGRGLSAAGPDALLLAAHRVLKRPEDLLLAEALRHAFHTADRDGAYDWYPALEVLLRDEQPGVRLTALRIYAGLRNPPEEAVALGADVLAATDPPETATYLTVLNGTSRPATYAWPVLLRTLWDRGEEEIRRQTLTAVIHLAHQQPDTAARFAAEIRLLEFADPASLLCLPVGGDLQQLLLALDVADREAAARGCVRLLDAAAAFRNKPVLERTLYALTRLTAEEPGTYARHAAGLPERLARLPQHKPWGASMDDLIVAGATAWAAAHGTAPVPLETADDCAIAMARGATTVADRVRLRGLAELLCGADPDSTRRVLDTVAAAATTPAAAADGAKYLLAPLLGKPDGSPGPSAARAWCRERLRPGPGVDAECGATGVIAKALDTDKVPLPAATIADCIHRTPADVPLQPGELSSWLTDPWPTVLTAAAAGGGHPQARLALDLALASAEGPGPALSTSRLRLAVGRRAAEPSAYLLAWLHAEAGAGGRNEGLRRLAQLDEKLLRRLLDDPAHTPQLHDIALHLQGGPGPDREAGMQLELRLAARGRLAPPTVRKTAERLRAAKQAHARQHIMDLTMAHLTSTRGLWQDEDPLTELPPVLEEIIERGRQQLDADDPSEHYTRQAILAGNKAYLFLVALHAHFADLSGPRLRASLDRADAYAFAPLDLLLPPGDEEAKPHRWRQRLAHLPTLAVRLAEHGHSAEARKLLDKAIRTMNEADPRPRQKWRNAAANSWRPYLRVISRTERASLQQAVLDYAGRDAWMARHLVEVAAQCLGDISAELLGLLGHPGTPPALLEYLRRVALWAGRGDRGTPWPRLFLELDRTTSSRPRPPGAALSAPGPVPDSMPPGW